VQAQPLMDPFIKPDKHHCLHPTSQGDTGAADLALGQEKAQN